MKVEKKVIISLPLRSEVDDGEYVVKDADGTHLFTVPGGDDDREISDKLINMITYGLEIEEDE